MSTPNTNIVQSFNVENATSSQPKKFKKRSYIIIGVVLGAIVVLWLVALFVMFFRNSGIFNSDFVRPVPDDPDLVNITGDVVDLTPEETEALNEKIAAALANIKANNS